MSRRRWSAALIPALVAAACARAPAAEVDLGRGRSFVPQVVDALDDVGFLPAVAVDAEGNPYVASFGFPARLAAGEIAVPRPVGAPFVPSVMLAARLGGAWTRGAVAMAEDPPAGVEIPFGPATVEAVADLSPETARGLDLAIGGDGGLHVAWSTEEGVWYGSNPDGSAFTVEEVPVEGSPGPVAVGVAADGTPWVATTATLEDGLRVVAAHRQGERWVTEEVAALPAPAPGADGSTDLALAPDGTPVVAFVDGDGTPEVATRGRGAWSTDAVDPGARAARVSLVVDAKGTASVAYYAGTSELRVATRGGGAWRATTVAEVGGLDGVRGATGIAADETGALYATWYDAATDSVLLATTDGGGGFRRVETRATGGGRAPDVAVTPDGGAVFLAWYDHDDGNLMLGGVEDVRGLALALPSPTAAPPTTPAPTGAPTTPPPATPAGCPEGTIVLVASPGAAVSGFDQTVLEAPAGKPFTICMDNRDVGVPHNAAVFTEAGGDLIKQTEVATGPVVQLLEMEPLEAGEYFYQCIVHPTTMTGTLKVG